MERNDSFLKVDGGEIKDSKNESVDQLMFEINSVFSDENLSRTIETVIRIKQNEIKRESNEIRKKLLENNLKKSIEDLTLHLKDKRHNAPIMFKNLLPVDENIDTKLNLDNMEKSNTEKNIKGNDSQENNIDLNVGGGKNENRAGELKTEKAEMLKAQIESEIKEMDSLMENLEIAFAIIASEKNLSGKEKTKQSKKTLGLFKSAIIKVKKRKDSQAKLDKIKEIQKDITKKLNGKIFEEEGMEGFDDLIVATNKCLEDLKNKYDKYVLDNKLGDEKEQFDQIILEYNNRIQEAATENNKKELEEIGFDIRANIESDIEMEEDVAENVNDDKKAEEGNIYKKNEDAKVAEEIIKDDVEKEVPPIVKKAIKDKNFAQELAAHEILKKTEDNRKNDEISNELIVDDIKEIKKSVYSLLGFFGKKFKKFKETYPEDVNFQNKISAIIDQYKKKANEFDDIKEPSRKTLTKINQLRHDMQKWADRDWIELYKRKIGASVSEKEVEKDVLQDLDDTDLHGAEIPADNKSAEEIERDKKFAELEDKYGKPGTDYVIYDTRTGFARDGFTIIDYELGADDKNTFVVVEKMIEGEMKEEKIDLKRFRKDKRNIRVSENFEEIEREVNESGENALIKEENELEEGDLTDEQKAELIAAIKEKRLDLKDDRLTLNDKLKDFIESYKEEKIFNKVLLKRVSELDSKEREMEKNDNMDLDILHAMIDLDKEIILAINENWEEELKKFKQNSINEKFGLNEKEQKIVEKSKEIIAGFIEDFRDKFDWDKFPKKKMEEFLDIQAMAFLMKSFTSKKWFIGNEENVAEFIVKNRNKTK